MRKLFFAVSVLALLLLVACPTATQQQKAAEAAQNASIVVKTFQAAEISSYQAGLIPAADHEFIEAQLVTVGEIGVTLDSCIRTATASAGTLSCITTATAAINQINTQGGLAIKTAGAKQDFQLAMTGVSTALGVLSIVLK